MEAKFDKEFKLKQFDLMLISSTKIATQYRLISRDTEMSYVNFEWLL